MCGGVWESVRSGGTVDSCLMPQAVHALHEHGVSHMMCILTSVYVQERLHINKTTSCVYSETRVQEQSEICYLFSPCLESSRWLTTCTQLGGVNVASFPGPAPHESEARVKAELRVEDIPM